MTTEELLVRVRWFGAKIRDVYSYSSRFPEGIGDNVLELADRCAALSKQRDDLQAANTSEVERRWKAEKERDEAREAYRGAAQRVNELLYPRTDETLKAHGLDPEKWG